jgi:hypothetical protein
LVFSKNQTETEILSFKELELDLGFCVFEELDQNLEFFLFFLFFGRTGSGIWFFKEPDHTQNHSNFQVQHSGAKYIYIYSKFSLAIKIIIYGISTINIGSFFCRFSNPWTLSSKNSK